MSETGALWWPAAETLSRMLIANAVVCSMLDRVYFLSESLFQLLVDTDTVKCIVSGRRQTAEATATSVDVIHSRYDCLADPTPTPSSAISSYPQRTFAVCNSLRYFSPRHNGASDPHLQTRQLSSSLLQSFCIDHSSPLSIHKKYFCCLLF